MKLQEKIKLTLIIPVYNEEEMISKSLTQVLSYLKNKKYKWEVVVVDDGSQDETADIVRGFSNGHVRFIKLESNQGKGAAIRAGIRRAAGEYILFSDADLSVPIEFLDTFLAEIGKKADVVVGSRRVEGSKIIKHQNLVRESLGRSFTFLSKVITLVNVSDFTCGFKGFSERAAKAIFSKTVIDHWAYDSEILFLAKKFGYRIVEIPVDWRNRKASRVSLGRDIITSFMDLIRIRINDFLGKYD